MSRFDDEAGAPRQSANYDVGYGKPPAEHRFKKGRSGNPKGRPRSSRKLASSDEPTSGFVLEAAYRMVRVQEGGRTKKMRAFEVAVATMFALGMKGSRPALKNFIDLVLVAEAKEAIINSTKLPPPSLDDFYKSIARKRLAECENKDLHNNGIYQPVDHMIINR